MSGLSPIIENASRVNSPRRLVTRLDATRQVGGLLQPLPPRVTGQQRRHAESDHDG